MRDELRRELERWGFSDTQIDVYVAILEIGEGCASEVADRAGVSSRHVYRVAEQLEERGLVDLDEHVQPTRVRARPPDSVDSVVERSRDTLVEGVQSLFAGATDRPVEVELLKRQPTVLERARDLLDAAEEWAFVVMPSEGVEHIVEELEAAVDRGVLVQFLTDEGPAADQLDLSDLGTIVRTNPSLEGFQEFAITVDIYTSLMVSPTASGGDDRRYSPALYLTDETLSPRILSSLQGYEWLLGDEQVRPKPSDLPFSSESFQHVVVEAALHRGEGTELDATIEGRRVADDEPVTVTARVADVRQGFVEPWGKSFLFEEALVVETDDGTATVGDLEATVEDYAAERVTLRER